MDNTNLGLRVGGFPLGPAEKNTVVAQYATLLLGVYMVPYVYIYIWYHMYIYINMHVYITIIYRMFYLCSKDSEQFLGPQVELGVQLIIIQLMG